MSEIDVWGRAETIQKFKPKSIKPPTGRGRFGENVVVNSNDFWWSEETQEWLPTVDTLLKITGPTEKSWPESH